MSLSVGIVGLPNVGKSTLFNALLKRQAALAANYPFATIEPNVGIVPLPDTRLEELAAVVDTEVIKPATVKFVDIAGLVKGASQGEGLGNQFLAQIRQTSIICHVLRAFSDENIIREGSKDPKTDLEIVRTELQLADLATLEKQLSPKGAVDKMEKTRWAAIERFREALNQGQPVHRVLADDQQLAQELSLLSAKPELLLLNVSEDRLRAGVEQLSKHFAKELDVSVQSVIVMSNQIESELSSLSDEDQLLYLHDLGLAASGLERLIKSAYQTLGLQSFLTAGEKEVRAWTVPIGATAQQAAGVIHTDFARLMISAKVASYADFIKYGGWKGLKEQGKMRVEGREYLVQADDVVEFMIGS